MQIIITLLFVLAAIIYVLWHLFRLFSGKINPCNGCQLKKNCQKFGQYKEK